ncbi:MAG: aminopeptidase P family protein [Alphaproteobacteria bacterium]|nr:aminopeptidase P family protein [Alphaproteobacteria bacterium]
MALHFTLEELGARRRRAAAAMQARGLDGLLLFKPESHYYLTGYDTFGYCFFQCLYLGADGRLTLLTRAPDLRQARHTSMIEDIRIWVDEAGRDPAKDLKAILAEHGCRGRKLGVEWQSYGLTAANGRLLEAELAGFCALEDASDLVSRLRVVKSPAELDYVRKAAELADAALAAAHCLARPGAFEGDILAAMQGAVFQDGGDYPGNEFIIGSGRDALLCRYFSGRRRLTAPDQLTLEFAGTYRRYHACLMRTLAIGESDAYQDRLHAAASESLAAARAALKPGRPIGEVFDAHARVLDRAGLQAHRMNACGYSLGAMYTPTWMDWPMFYAGNPEPAAPDMVFFLHIIVMDSGRGKAMTLGETVRVTPDGSERLSQASLDHFVGRG